MYIFSKFDLLMGLVNCSKYTISAFDITSSPSIGMDSKPDIPKPTNDNITAFFYHVVFLNAVELLLEFLYLLGTLQLILFHLLYVLRVDHLGHM